MNVTKRDFLHKTNSYLKPGELVVTSHGVPVLKLVITIPEPDNVVTSNVVTKKPTIVITNKCSVPGCNFERYTESGLCMKHWKEA